MSDDLSERYKDLLAGSYDCVDRIVLNGYFRMAHTLGNSVECDASIRGAFRVFLGPERS